MHAFVTATAAGCLQVAAVLTEAVKATATHNQEARGLHSLSLKRPLMVEAASTSSSASNRVAPTAWPQLAQHLLTSADSQQAPGAAAMTLLSLAVVRGAVSSVDSVLLTGQMLPLLVWISSYGSPTKAAMQFAGSGDFLECPESSLMVTWRAVQALQEMLRPGEPGANWLRSGCVAEAMEVAGDDDSYEGQSSTALPGQGAWNPMHGVIDFLRP